MLWPKKFLWQKKSSCINESATGVDDENSACGGFIAADFGAVFKGGTANPAFFNFIRYSCNAKERWGPIV